MGHPELRGDRGHDRAQRRGHRWNGTPHERARAGIFLAFQRPMAIPGVKMADFLRHATTNVRNPDRKEGEELIPMREFRKELNEKMDQLRMDAEFARRYVNDGFSGGEMKRAEILQLAMLRPKFAILDETDSGLDVDAVKLASQSIAEIGGEEMGILIITHHDKLLEHNVPDFTHVMLGGRIVETGGAELAARTAQAGLRPHPRGVSRSGRRRRRPWQREADEPRLTGVELRTSRDNDYRSKRTRSSTRKRVRSWQPTLLPRPDASAKSTSTISAPSRSDVFKARKGSTREIVAQISEMKSEPAWMRDFRLQSLEIFESKPMPHWGGDIGIDFQDIYYYLKPTDHQGKTWDDVPRGNQGHLRPAGHSRSGEEVPRRREGPVRERSRLRLAAGRPRQEGRDLHRHRHGGARASRPGARVLRHDHSAGRTTSSPRSTRPSGRAGRSSTCPRA